MTRKEGSLISRVQWPANGRTEDHCTAKWVQREDRTLLPDAYPDAVMLDA